MRTYEMIFIVHPELDEDAFDGVIDRVKELIERHTGKIVEQNIWGLRRLAYSIQDQWEGQYVLMELELDPQGVNGLERDLGLLEPIIRHLIVRKE